HTLAQIMLPGRDRVPAAVARQPGHRVLAFERGDHVAPGRVLAGEEDPDLHDASDAGQVASFLKLVDDRPQGSKRGGERSWTALPPVTGCASAIASTTSPTRGRRPRPCCCCTPRWAARGVILPGFRRSVGTTGWCGWICAATAAPKSRRPI